MITVKSKAIVCSFIKQSVHSWHTRLGHPSLKHLSHLKSLIHVDSFKGTCTDKCLICPLAKQRRLSFQSNNNLASHIFDLIHCDWGPYKVPTHAGYRFFLTKVDDFSRYTWIFLMKNKLDVLSFIARLFTLIETQYGTSIKAFCNLDNL